MKYTLRQLRLVPILVICACSAHIVDAAEPSFPKSAQYLLAQVETAGIDLSSTAVDEGISLNTIVNEGIGFDEFVLGDVRCNKEFIKARLGEPAEETDYWLNYRPQFGIDFSMAGPDGPIREIRLNKGFQGRLSSNVSLYASMKEVFSVYGAPVAEKKVLYFGKRQFIDRTLYRLAMYRDYRRLFYRDYRLVFWSEGDEIQQIIILPATGPVPPPLRKLPVPTHLPELRLPANPRWLPLIRIERLWDYVTQPWILFYLAGASLALLLFLLPSRIRRLYYYLRPLPEGRLIVVKKPSGALESNINIWYEARRLRKRKLIIGSSKDADIRLCHESISDWHALIVACRFEDGVLTYIQPLSESKTTVNHRRNSMMELVRNAEIEIGDYEFQYEQPNEYRQVQVRYRNGKVLEGVPASWDTGSRGFILIPSRARSWMDAKFIPFSKTKGIYFMRDWDEDVRKKLLRGGKDLFQHPATIHFFDGETMPGYMIGDYTKNNQRFYFFPQEQSGDVVYILVERSGVKKIAGGKISGAVPTPG